ncbi:unnamed protein product [Sphagnum troendelagicum]|uniref:Dof-type domain-containing protein n=1 Tax=Sphagnum troendelagicum TaxID=128251 RepID=A0ABP0V2T8_9BRYO
MSKLRKWLMKEERVGSPISSVDPAIKLFGRTIAVTGGSTDAENGEETSDAKKAWDAEEEAGDAKETGEEMVPQTEDNCTSHGTGTADGLGSSLGSNNRPAEAEEEKSMKSGKRDSDSTVTGATGTETVAVGAEVSEGRSMEHKKEEEEGGQEIGSQGKTLKKPDKPAPCPRCESLDTKFCYYNNYNINQPRHFCKSCQRYWTAGGTLRNVPVGAGRRKNKHVGLQARHGAVADGSVMSMVRPDSRETAQQLLPPPGSKISPSKHPQIPGQCPTLPALNASSGAGGEINLMGGFQVSSKSCSNPAVNGSQNGVSAIGEVPSEVEKKEVVDECASSLSEPVSSATQEASANNGGPMPLHPNLQPEVGGLYRPMSMGDAGVLAAGGTGAPFGFYNGAWPYGFNVGWSGAVPAVSPGVVGSGQLLPGNGMATWNPPPSGVWPGAGVLPWGSPVPGMPGSPWVVPPGWGGGWTVPLPWATAAAAAAAAQAAASTAGSTASGSAPPSSKLPGSTTPALGKHPRERPEGRRVDGALWAPKTLRIDDPKEAARSSVWNALGMPSPPESVLSGSMFKAFQPKTETKLRTESQQQRVKQSTGQQT